MASKNRSSRILHTLGIILLGLTAAFHLLGGIGTTCVALAAENYPSMLGIVPYKWVYQLFVVGTIAIAVLGIRATVQFARRKPGGYRTAIWILAVGAVVTTVHIVISRALRGSSMPNDARLYMNLLALVVFLLFQIPGVKAALALDENSAGPTGGAGLGAAAIIMGIVTLTVHIWAGPTHTINGVNYADVWHTQLLVVGWGVVILGLGLITKSMLVEKPRRGATFPGVPDLSENLSP
jgi:hypothetical protein